MEKSSWLVLTVRVLVREAPLHLRPDVCHHARHLECTCFEALKLRARGDRVGEDIDTYVVRKR